MLTRTCELAIKAVLYVALEGEGKPLSPRRMAESLNCSPSYLSKTTNLLVKAGLLRSHRGIKGGVVLGKLPEQITLLEIVEACQGLLIAGYCEELPTPQRTCGFHRAMQELHEAMLDVLLGWTVTDLMKTPARCPGSGIPSCKMFFEECGKYFVTPS